MFKHLCLHDTFISAFELFESNAEILQTEMLERDCLRQDTVV